MQVKTHSFHGKRYEIFIDDLDGWCDNPNPGERRAMVITGSLNTRLGLISLIHESLHAERWGAKEETVKRTAKEIGSLLWRLGFRKVK